MTDAAPQRAASRQRRPPVQRNAQRGVGLIEVLIAVLVMAIGALGIAAMQAAALRNSQSALERSQAVIHSYAVLDAMRANLEEARGGKYNTSALMCTVPAADGTQAGADQARWLAALHATFGDQSCGQIECGAPASIGGASECKVTVQWNDARGTEGDAAQQIITRTRI